jgi:putative mRNA 3-end processing factor
MDHLSSGAVMTPGTLDVLRARRGRGTGTPLEYHRAMEVGGFDVSFRPAGHTFGSAMIRVDDLLYTGDFNPEGGETCGTAAPEACETLVLDATYGRPGLSFPPKAEVERDLLSWTEAALGDGPVAVGGYEFGKAQELISLFNRLPAEVAVSDGIADLADICVAHGVSLRYRRLSEISAEERRDPRIYVLPSGWVRDPLPDPVTWIRERGGKLAYVSGWAVVWDLVRSRGVDAQFPLSDHADFEGLLEFTAACAPRRAYTVFTHARELAGQIERRLRIRAEPARRRKDAERGGRRTHRRAA